MKKLSIWILVLLLVAVLAMPVLAAGSATMTLSASKTTLKQGDTFTVTVSTTSVENCTTGGFLFQFDEQAFAYVDGSALVSGFTMSGVSTLNGKIAGYFMATGGSATVKGELFRITLKVKSNAASGSYTISGTPSLTVQEGGEKVSASATADSVTVTVDGGETQPTEQETTAATTEPAQSTATEPAQSTATEPAQSATTEPTQSATSEATTGETVEVTMEDPEILPTKGEQTEAPTEILTIGATTPTPQKTGFPWWIIFAVMGIGSIIAIVVIQKKS